MNTRICHSLLLAFLLLANMSPCRADKLVREIRWSDLDQQKMLTSGTIAKASEPGVDEFLRIEGADEGPSTMELFTISSPGILQLQYAVVGRVRYTGVAGDSYLEMWSHFPDGSFYFTRTLADTGPMQKFAGDSSWRDFSLPFFSSSETGVPSRLVVNLVMSGQGMIELSSLRLVEYESANALQTAAHGGGWWGLQVGVMLGAGGGTLLGLLGGAIGVLSGLGVARRFVLAVMTTLFAAGCISVVAGLVAVFQRQPYHVYYPLLLLGLISVAVIGPLLRVVRRRYEQGELRRVAALDVGAAR